MFATCAEGGDSDLEGMLERKHEWESTTKKASHRSECLAFFLPCTSVPDPAGSVINWPSDSYFYQQSEKISEKMLIVDAKNLQN